MAVLNLHDRISSNISVPETAADRTAATAAHCSCFICSLIPINWCDPNQPIAMLLKFSSISKKRTSVYFHKHNKQRRNSSDAAQQWTQWHLEAGWENPWIWESSISFCSMILLFCYEALTSLIHIHFWFPLLFYASCSILFYLFQLKKHLILMPVLT